MAACLARLTERSERSEREAVAGIQPPMVGLARRLLDEIGRDKRSISHGMQNATATNAFAAMNRSNTIASFAQMTILIYL